MTLHSAKGLEFPVVAISGLEDGLLPHYNARNTDLELEEERRLLYVAMTRARDALYLVHPQRFFVRQQHRHGDRHVYTPRTRFIPDAVLDRFERSTHGRPHPDEAEPRRAPAARLDGASKARSMWR